MTELHCRGLVIQRTPVNEIDAMVRMICNDGVWGFFLPRGFLVSAGYLSVFRPLNWVNILFTEKGDLRVIYDYRDYSPVDETIMGSSEKRELFFEAIRLYSRILDASFSNEMGALFRQTYNLLVSGEFPVQGLRFSFLALFVLFEGVFPSIGKCSNCGENTHGTSRFSTEAGGYICTGCSETIPWRTVETKLERALTYIRKHPKNTLTKSNWNDELFKYNNVLATYLDYHFTGGNK